MMTCALLFVLPVKKKKKTLRAVNMKKTDARNATQSATQKGGKKKENQPVEKEKKNAKTQESEQSTKKKKNQRRVILEGEK